MKNYLLTISYDGTDYHGWQRQNGQTTVQESLEEALRGLFNCEVTATASGRTDEGVHALKQAVSFMADTSVPTEKIPAALNGILPPDIRAIDCMEVPDGFCARKSAKRKTYAYRFYISPTPHPHLERYALRVDNLDTSAMRKACEAVVGTHDFSNFYCLGSSAKTTVRTVYSCELREYAPQGTTPAVMELEICGNGFLYKMVRLIAGALIRVGKGEISVGDFVAAVEKKCENRKIPAPSKGLTLVKVEYDDVGEQGENNFGS